SSFSLSTSRILRIAILFAGIVLLQIGNRLPNKLKINTLKGIPEMWVKVFTLSPEWVFMLNQNRCSH
ncbi:hypothetical protein C9J03_24710, partial [Photobacterium gaetbulicola]